MGKVNAELFVYAQNFKVGIRIFKLEENAVTFNYGHAVMVLHVSISYLVQSRLIKSSCLSHKSESLYIL